MANLALAAAFAAGSIEVDVAAADAFSAITRAGDLLVASGRTSERYTAEMLEALTEFGPYFVIAPGLAIAHARPSESVFSTGLSLAVLREPIAFGNQANDPVRLVFALCAKDHDAHLLVLSQLAEKLGDESCVNILLNASTEAQIRSALL
ncbi:MAG: PTS sugar transporter subunit IIA [Microbacteriaceae bacterium]